MRWGRLTPAQRSSVCPSLRCTDPEDVATLPDGSRRLFTRVASADKQLYIYDGLAHDLLHEPERARVVRDVIEWMTDRSRA